MLEIIQNQQEDGQELVEFALLLPVLLLMLLGIMEFGMAVLSYDTVANVSREVARYAIVHQTPTEPEFDAYIDDYIDNSMERWTTGVNDDVLSVTVTMQDDAFRDRINVIVDYEHQLFTGPIIRAAGGSPTVTMRTQSTMYSE